MQAYSRTTLWQVVSCFWRRFASTAICTDHGQTFCHHPERSNGFWDGQYSVRSEPRTGAPHITVISATIVVVSTDVSCEGVPEERNGICFSTVCRHTVRINFPAVDSKSLLATEKIDLSPWRLNTTRRTCNVWVTFCIGLRKLCL
jgi:hypothetical protein